MGGVRDDVRFLLEHDVEPDMFECDKCGCPIGRFFRSGPDHLKFRCASCCHVHRHRWGGKEQDWRFAINEREEWLHKVADDVRWDEAMAYVERQLGREAFNIWLWDNNDALIVGPNSRWH